MPFKALEIMLSAADLLRTRLYKTQQETDYQVLHLDIKIGLESLAMRTYDIITLIRGMLNAVSVEHAPQIKKERAKTHKIVRRAQSLTLWQVQRYERAEAIHSLQNAKNS
jgi:hypothetical protein